MKLIDIHTHIYHHISTDNIYKCNYSTYGKVDTANQHYKCHTNCCNTIYCHLS